MKHNKAMRQMLAELPTKLDNRCVACRGTGYYDIANSPPCGSCGGLGINNKEIDMTEKMIEELKKLASAECWSDDPDFMVDDFAGGNIDDAFDGGHRAGQIELARDLLSELGISWSV